MAHFRRLATTLLFGGLGLAIGYRSMLADAPALRVALVILRFALVEWWHDRYPFDTAGVTSVTSNVAYRRGLLAFVRRGR